MERKMPYRTIDLSKVRTYPLPQRASKVALENLILPERDAPPFDNPELKEVADRIVAARKAGRPVIWMIGGHVVKRGLSPVLIDLMARGVITHLASNGATTIHDFEIGLKGQTSEDVARNLEDGSFGMAEETGSMMNRAIRAGARDGIGIGEALGRMMAEDGAIQYKQYSLLYNAYRLGIPFTVHVAIGTDIIHQHPEADFAAIGWGSGQDFKVYTAAVSELEGGVFCNFGSAVLGPEVFLKAISIVRNLGYTVKTFTTANFDLIPLGDYRKPIGDDVTDYYYRPRKNIVNRPVSLGGRGYHITGDHNVTIPNLHHMVVAGLAGDARFNPSSVEAGREALQLMEHVPAGAVERLESVSPQAAHILSAALATNPPLETMADDLASAFIAIERSFSTGGTFFIAGNGGSMADALHISGELDKAYRLARPIQAGHRQRLSRLPGGEELSQYLQAGLPTIALGVNPTLSSAVDNDVPLAHIGMAQELYALAHAGDVFMGISTSGNAKNVIYAAMTARTLGLTVIGLTGQGGGRLAEAADIVVRALETDTALVQQWHIQLYHVLCEMLEAHFFAGAK
jgi:phosphoheptose isomerase